MAINLLRGQCVDFDKNMTMALIGLGWDVNQYDSGKDFDLDASAFMLKADNQVRNNGDFIFYGNLGSKDGSVIHTGDNRTGAGDGDDEVLIIDFTKVSADIQKITITVTIYDADVRRQNFGQVSNAYVRVAKITSPEDQNGTEILKFNLVEEFSIETAIVVCEIYRCGKEWEFNAVGAGYKGGLAALCRNFGVSV